MLRNCEIKKTKRGMMRAYNGRVHLLVPHEKWVGKLTEYKAIRIIHDDNGSDILGATHRGELINRTDIDILRRYNAEVRGMYNYYCIADNVWVIGQFAGLMKHSMLKTFACKYRTKVSRIKERYVHDSVFSVHYCTQSGIHDAEFMHSFTKQLGSNLDSIDIIPSYKRYDRLNSLAIRMKARVCELCGKKDCEVIMHQVRRLKDLRGNTQWEMVMLDIHRKTLAVCQECHDKIHAFD